MSLMETDKYEEPHRVIVFVSWIGSRKFVRYNYRCVVVGPSKMLFCTSPLLTGFFAYTSQSIWDASFTGNLKNKILGIRGVL